MNKVHNKYKDTAPVDAVYIGRGSPYGNPYVIGQPHPQTGKPMTRDEVCDLFEQKVLPQLDLSGIIGKDLICFCKPKRCHGDALIKAARRSNHESTGRE